MESDSSSGSDSDSSRIKELFHIINLKERRAKKISENDRIEQIEKCLQEPGSNINVRDKNGNTLLHVAVRKNYKVVVDFLLNKGSSVIIKNNKCETPLELVKRLDNKFMIKLIEQYYEERVEVSGENRNDKSSIEKFSDSRPTSERYFDDSVVQRTVFPNNNIEKQQISNKYHQQQVAAGPSTLPVGMHPEKVQGFTATSHHVTSTKNLRRRYDGCSDRQQTHASEIDNGVGVCSFLEVTSKDEADFLNFIKETIHTGISSFIRVNILKNAHVDDNVILSELSRLDTPLLMECQSSSETKVYLKECGKEPVFIDLSSSTKTLCEEELTRRLSSKNSFGIGLVVEALKSGFAGSFQESDSRSLTRVTFDVTKRFDDWKLIDYAAYHDDILTAQFLTLHDWDLNKSEQDLILGKEGVRTLEIAAEYANTDTLAALLQLQINRQSDKPIVLPEEKGNLLLLSNVLGETLVLISAKAGKKENVGLFIKCGADIRHHNKAGKSAIDLAWENKHYDVVLLLLKADSEYPNLQSEEFTMSEVDKDVFPEELSEFFCSRKRLMQAIEDGSLNEVREIVGKSRIYIGTSQGKSEALVSSISQKQYKIYAYLQSVGITFTNERENDECLKELSRSEIITLQSEIDHTFKSVKDAHIMFLVSKSKSTLSNMNDKSFRTKVEECFRELDQIEEISMILQVIASRHSGLEGIIFDFRRESIIGTSINSSHTTPGITNYQEGKVYIGAKGLSSGNTDDVLGTLAHELAHFAMQMLFGNEYSPYGKSDNVEVEIFRGITKEIFDRIECIDPIIQNVFTNYGESEWHSELIARVPHMLAKYGEEDGRSKLQQEAPALMKYFNDEVLHRCETYTEESHLIKPRNDMELLKPYLGVIDSLQQADVKFKNPYKLDEFLDQPETNIYIISTKNIWSSSCNVYQAVETILQSSKGNRYLFLRMDQFKDAIFDVFKTDAIDLMVFQCHPPFDRIQQITILKELKKILPKKLNKKIIFIINESNKDEFLTSAVESGFNCCLDNEDPEITLIDLTEDSQNKLLLKEVTFQGHRISLSELIDDSVEMRKLVDSGTLEKLIRNEDIIISQEVPVSSGYNKDYYISRHVNHHIEINTDYLRNNFDRDFVAISGIDKSSLRRFLSVTATVRLFQENDLDPANPIRFIILNDHHNLEVNFKQLCEQYPTPYNVHWLSFGSGKLIWQKSRGSVSNLIKYRVEEAVRMEEKCYPEELLLQQCKESNVVIISDTAGMGKTTILSSLSNRLVVDRPSLWVVCINLNDYNSFFEEVTNLEYETSGSIGRTEELVMNTILESKLKTSLDKKLFSYNFENSGRVVVLMDGFDEISPNYADLVMGLVQSLLRKMSVETVFITTRPNMRNILERKLDAFAHTLVPFSEPNQIEFMTKFWNHNTVTSGFNEQQCKDYAKALILKLKNSIGDTLYQLIGIPLHAKMLAESFKDHQEIPEKLDTVDLYDTFIEKMFEIYQKEKGKIDTSNPANINERRKLYTYFLKEHRMSAVATLFNEEEFKYLLSDEDQKEVNTFTMTIKVGNERTGIIDQIINNKPHFIHRTFVEYFVADFFASKIRDGTIKDEESVFLLKNVLIKQEYQVVRAFFDGKLQSENQLVVPEVWFNNGSDNNEGRETALHISAKEGTLKILNMLLNTFQKHPIFLHSYVNAKNNENSTAHFVSARYGHLKILETLMHCNHYHCFDLNTISNDGTTLMLEAGNARQWHVVKWLADKGAFINAFNIIGKTALHLAARFGEMEVVEFLVDKGGNVFAKDRNGKTVLHFAAEGGKLEIVQFLVERGVDITTCDTAGRTVLHAAAHRGNIQVVEWLVDNGADVLASDNHGHRGLHFAADGGQLKAVHWLLEREAAISAGDIV